MLALPVPKLDAPPKNRAIAGSGTDPVRLALPQPTTVVTRLASALALAAIVAVGDLTMVMAAAAPDGAVGTIGAALDFAAAPLSVVGRASEAVAGEGSSN